MMKQTVLFATLMLMATLSEAGVYKCVNQEAIVYSEQPCANDAKPLNIQSKEPSAESLSSAQARQKNDSRSSEISNIEREISGYKEDMDRELAALRKQQESASNNLAGATWLQSISTEMSAVTSKYQIKIQEAQHRLDVISSKK